MSYKKRLLLIEDDPHISQEIKAQALAHGYRLHIETNGLHGYKAVERERPDLILMDISLPGIHGFDLCKKIKSSPSLKSIPMILLSDQAAEIDIILGFELGADDYLIKPFSPPLLFARIKAILRRTQTLTKPVKLIEFGPYTLELDRHLLRKEHQMVTLTLSEFNILKRLLTQQKRTLTRGDLLRDIQQDDPFIIDRNIDVHIASLRKKLGEEGKYIRTIRGIGYQFSGSPSEKLTKRE